MSFKKLVDFLSDKQMIIEETFQYDELVKFVKVNLFNHSFFIYVSSKYKLAQPRARALTESTADLSVELLSCVLKRVKRSDDRIVVIQNEKLTYVDDELNVFCIQNAPSSGIFLCYPLETIYSTDISIVESYQQFFEKVSRAFHLTPIPRPKIADLHQQRVKLYEQTSKIKKDLHEHQSYHNTFIHRDIDKSAKLTFLKQDLASCDQKYQQLTVEYDDLYRTCVYTHILTFFDMFDKMK